MSCTFDELFFYLQAILETMPKPDKSGKSETSSPPQSPGEMERRVSNFASRFKMPIHEFKVPEKG